MKPETWGPFFWNTLHSVAAGYPKTPTKDEKNEYKDFFLSFGKVLPCEECRDNFKEMMSQHPLEDSHLENNETISIWVFELHNMVNNKLGKPKYEWFRVVARYRNQLTTPESSGVGSKYAESRVASTKNQRTMYYSKMNSLPIRRDTSLGRVRQTTPMLWKQHSEQINFNPRSTGADAKRNYENCPSCKRS